MQVPEENRLVLFVAKGTEAIRLQEEMSDTNNWYDEARSTTDSQYSKSIAELNAMYVQKVLLICQQAESRIELLAEPEDDTDYNDDDD